MAKRKINPPQFAKTVIIGFQCPMMKGSRLAFLINSTFDFDLQKSLDFVWPSEKETDTIFDFFYHKNNELELHYHLLGNKSGSAFLVPKLAAFDYLMLVQGAISRTNHVDLVERMHEIEDLFFVDFIPEDHIKDLDSILGELELLNFEASKRIKDFEEELSHYDIQFYPKNQH